MWSFSLEENGQKISLTSELPQHLIEIITHGKDDTFHTEYM